MSNNIYDILGKLNGLAPKENPVSTADPIYESVDPRGDIIEAITSLEKKYTAFNENIVAEKKKKKSAEKIKQPDAGDITSADATINALLTKARFSRPGAKNDLEAIVYHIAKQDEELERAKAAEEEDRLLIKKAQSVTDQMNDRFKKLNAKVAAGQITAQDQEIAQAAQQIEKDADAAKAAIAADPTAPVQQIVEPTVKTQKTAAPTVQKTEPEANNIYNFPTQEPAPVQTVAPAVSKSKIKSAELNNQPKPSVGAGLHIASPRLNPNFPVDTTVDAANTDPLSQFIGRPKKVGNMKETKATQLEEMDTGVSSSTGIQNAQKIANFLSAHQKYREALENPQPGYTPQQPPVSVVLQFISSDGRQNVINLSKSTVDKLINSLKRPGTTNQDRSDFTNIILADADKLRDYMNNLNAPRPVRKVVSVNKGQDIPDMDQDKFSGNKKLPQGSRETELEENLGNYDMKKPTTIAEAVRELEEKYMGFKKTVAAIKKGGSAEDPEAVAAAIGRKKYGKKAFQKAAADGKKLGEAAKPDFLDLDKDGDTEEPMKKAAKDAKEHEPAKPDADAVAKRKRLQALKDKQEDERAERGDDHKSSSRVVKGRAYGGSAQKDDEDKDELAEKAPPGAKAERMVKHIKKGYSKDGKLTKKEKGIAYATAWKAHNKGQVEEATEFGDVVKNSKAELKKHKMVKEGRNPESSEYTYETVGRILSDEQPGLDCNSEAFVKAVYDELIEMKLTPKAARWLVHYDEDFISDCATSYSHFCDSKEKEAMECGAPMNSFVSEEPLMDAQQELDEIARLAGLTREDFNPMVPGDSASPLTYAGCSKCNADPCCCEDEKAMDEGMGCSEEELNEAATRKDFRMVADLLKSIPDIAKRTELAMHHADIFKKQNPRFKKEMFLAAAGVDTTPIKDVEDEVLVGEAEVEEGNEFSGALAKARAEGKKEFEVDGKKYTVKEDININVSANGEEDVVNLIRKLSGMPVIAVQAQPAMAEEVVAEEGPKERDIEYTNTPREEVAGTDAAIPAGGDLNRAKKQYKKEYPGDNPMAVAEAKEEALWKAYETMINDVKA